VQVVGLLRTHRPFYAPGDFLTTKLNGLETLFYGTAVVVLWCEDQERAPDIHQSVKQILAILLILVVLDMTFIRSNKRRFETSIRADPLHCRATDQTATETRRPLHFFA
jgi:hypothetical protein